MPFGPSHSNLLGGHDGSLERVMTEAEVLKEDSGHGASAAVQRVAHQHFSAHDNLGRSSTETRQALGHSAVAQSSKHRITLQLTAQKLAMARVFPTGRAQGSQCVRWCSEYVFAFREETNIAEVLRRATDLGRRRTPQCLETRELRAHRWKPGVLVSFVVARNTGQRCECDENKCRTTHTRLRRMSAVNTLRSGPGHPTRDDEGTLHAVSAGEAKRGDLQFSGVPCVASQCSCRRRNVNEAWSMFQRRLKLTPPASQLIQTR